MGDGDVGFFHGDQLSALSFQLELSAGFYLPSALSPEPTLSPEPSHARAQRADDGGDAVDGEVDVLVGGRAAEAEAD